MNSQSPLCLYFIRHGETEWSLSGQHTGQTNLLLTENGKIKAQELGHQLRHIPFTHILTSPLERARQTCALVALVAAPEIEADLIEWNYGDYEGLRSGDIRQERPDWNIFRDGCPNGEMPAQVGDRADQLIARLCQMDGNVALFSHGQFGDVLAARWLGLEVARAEHFHLDTASIRIFTFNPFHPTVPIIALWNAHGTQLMWS